MTQLQGKVFETAPKTQTDFEHKGGSYYITYRERLLFHEDGKVELFRIMIEDQWQNDYPLERHRFFGRYTKSEDNPARYDVILNHHFLKIKLAMKCLAVAGQTLICQGTLTNAKGEMESFDEYFAKNPD